MIKYILIDDEAKNIRGLKKLLTESCPDASFAGMATYMGEAEKLIQDTRPDLAFLDIQMPDGNVFDLLDRLLPVKFEVIFVTAFDDYSLKAFRYCALDYLLKPVQTDELIDAVEKASERVRLKNINQQLSSLLVNFHQPDITSYQLAIPNMESLVFITVGEIMRCEAKGGYTVFFMKNGKEVLSSKSIGVYEELLPSKFFLRIHHSHIVNLCCVRKYHKGRGGYIEMEDRAEIEVSIRRRNEFLSRFGI